MNIFLYNKFIMKFTYKNILAILSVFVLSVITGVVMARSSGS